VCLWKHSRILCGYLYSWTRSHPIVSADVGMTTVVRREPARPVNVLGRSFCSSRRISSARGGGPRVQSVDHDVRIQAGGYQSPQVVCCAALLSGSGCRMRWCDGVIECRCQAEWRQNLTIDTMRTTTLHPIRYTLYAPCSNIKRCDFTRLQFSRVQNIRTSITFKLANRLVAVKR